MDDADVGTGAYDARSGSVVVTLKASLPRTGDVGVNGVAVALLALAGVILVLVSRRFRRRQK